MILSAWATICGFWILIVAFRVRRFFGALEDLAIVQPLSAGFKWPKVSLVIPACNEAATLGPAVESLLELDYSNLEIVLIDDRSTDGTGEVVRALAAKDTRVRAVSIDTLPHAWLGKVHALATGEKLATGDWILFTDADVVHGAQSLKKAMTVALERRLDFLCVVPEIIAPTFSLRILIAQFFQNAACLISLDRINDPLSGDCVGAGAYNLVRRAALAETKGLEWLRLEIIDDVGLAQMMKESGAALGVMNGMNEISIEWYADLPAFVRGLEKNSFALFEYSYAALFAFTLLTWTLVAGVTVVPWILGATTAAFFAFGSLCFSLAVAALSMGRVFRGSAAIAAWYPVSLAAMPLIAWRAAWYCFRRGGIQWRTTFYPVEALRAGQRVKSSHLLRRKLMASRVQSRVEFEVHHP